MTDRALFASLDRDIADERWLEYALESLVDYVEGEPRTHVSDFLDIPSTCDNCSWEDIEYSEEHDAWFIVGFNPCSQCIYNDAMMFE